MILRAILLSLTVLWPAQAVLAESNVHAFDNGHPPEMLLAINKARASLPTLIDKTMGANGRMAEGVSFKVAIPISEGFENIWVHTIRKRSGGYRGKLGNHPAGIKGKRINDPIRFTHSQIVDWSLQASDGRNFGHFTTRVILKNLSSGQVASIGATLTRSPLPKGF